jgi:tyrosyl-tRNA synthetase
VTDATASAALNKHVALLLPPGGIEAKLAQAQGRPLVVKLGFDPTSPDLHLGHAVVLRKLRDFVDAGHKVRIIIGDFTAAIGDPTGRNNARPPLSQDQISQNAQTYMAQVYKILPVDKVSFHRNSEWLGAMTPYDIIKMTSQVTVSRILSRDDFKDRIKTNVPIQMHEILYPLFQGWDSVAIEADIEIGGTDQLFNCSMGRDLQSAAGQPEQVVLTMPLLVGLDGVDKMSKSNGNYIALNDPPEVMYRKCMSIPDSAMHDYMRLACDFDDDAISNYASGLKDSSHHPMTIKKMIAGNIVTIYHGLSAAEDAAEHFAGTCKSDQVTRKTISW